jgi:WD domain, G-beta repeat
LRMRGQKSVNSDQHSITNAHLRGGWLVFARICWFVLAALALTVFVSSLPLYFADIQSACDAYSPWCQVGQLHLGSALVLHNLGISVGSYAVFAFVLTIVIAMVWFVVGGLIFWRKSDERVALLVSIALVLYGSQGGNTFLLTGNNPVWTIAYALVQSLAYVALFLVLFLFPDGHFVPRWMRWIAVGLILLIFVTLGLSNLMPAWPLNPWNPQFSPFFLVLVTSFVIGLVTFQIYRYRRISSPIQRRQTKLVVYALSIFFLGTIVVGVGIDIVLLTFFPALSPPDPLQQVIDSLGQNILPLLIPLSLVIAMFRYRLWDIDIIIKRTLVYGTLTGTLILVYVGSILILQVPLSGFTSGNTLALVGSTLLIAALFRPLRHRIQAIIDRRFYRRKYDAARTIAAFSATLREEVDLNTLSEQLVAVVQETMQPAYVSLWLQKYDRQEQQRYVGLTAEKAPSRQSINPVSETEETEKSAELPGPPSSGISRRAVMIGLAAGGVVLAGGGLSWWLFKRRAFFTYTGHTDWVYTVAWSPDGKRLASCSKDKTVQVWDASDGGYVFTYDGHKDEVVTVAWAPDGTRLASGGGNLDQNLKTSDKTVQVWDATDGGHIFTYHGHTDAVQAVAWSPDGTRIASASFDKTVQVWDATDGDHPFSYHGHTDKVFIVNWSPNGKYLASGSTDKTAQIWNAADGGHIFTYTGHTDWVNGVAWSPDSRRIASASADKTAQVWDAADGGHVFVYNGHTDAVITTAWSPDGTRIASSSFDNTVQIWSPR